ncbi:MAG: HD domain-containing protein [Kiritimatiellaeota bacterium]|nr:HD domain-containing protein [Kiritimatiellota bacterium]
MTAVPACHDWDHTERVLRNARHLARVEGADATVVEFAAVLHDIGRPRELADRGKTCHAEFGARLARGVLEAAGISDVAFIEHVAACVRTHRYRSRNGEMPATLESKVVFDADKLDSLGAVGIGRAFHFAGRFGARLHNTAAEALASDSYSTEDTAFREYLVKLRKVPGCMLTDEGRRLAVRRRRFMDDFFEQLAREVEGSDF